MNWPRWYCVDKAGHTIPCTHQRDATNTARDCDVMWPLRAPHRPVQLVDVAETQESLTLLAKAIGRFTADPADAKLIMAEAVFRIEEQNTAIRGISDEVERLKALLTSIHADLLKRTEAVQRSDGITVVDLSHSLWLRIKEAIK